MIDTIALAESILRKEGVADPDWDSLYDAIECKFNKILQQTVN